MQWSYSVTLTPVASASPRNLSVSTCSGSLPDLLTQTLWGSAGRTQESVTDGALQVIPMNAQVRQTWYKVNF